MEEPAKFLKILHDHHPEFKLIISGSSSFEIQKRFSDALTGRKIVFTVYSLNFAEYLVFKNSNYKDIKREINLRKILENIRQQERSPFLHRTSALRCYVTMYLTFQNNPAIYHLNIFLAGLF